MLHDYSRKIIIYHSDPHRLAINYWFRLISMGVILGKPSSVTFVDDSIKADRKGQSKPYQYFGSKAVIKVEGGTIVDLGSQGCHHDKNIPGSSTGTEFTYIPNFSTVKRKQHENSHESTAQFLFVEPAKENEGGGDFVYYVSNLNGQNVTIRWAHVVYYTKKFTTRLEGLFQYTWLSYCSIRNTLTRLTKGVLPMLPTGDIFGHDDEQLTSLHETFSTSSSHKDMIINS